MVRPSTGTTYEQLSIASEELSVASRFDFLELINTTKYNIF